MAKPKNVTMGSNAPLEHPNAFRAGDGRILYRYEVSLFEGDDEAKEITVLPKPLEEMTEQDYYDLPIQTVMQAGRVPQNLTVIFKDKQWAGHWFNKKAGHGSRVGVARALGFVPAKVEDLESYFHGLNDKDGALEQEDLVLMKIHKHKLYMRFAEAMAQAKAKGSIEGYRAVAMSGRRQGVDEKDMTYYHTPQALKEVQGLGRAPGE